MACCNSGRKWLLPLLIVCAIAINAHFRLKALSLPALKGNEVRAYFQDRKGWTYFSDPDSFRWMRRIESYLNTGRFGVQGPDGREYDYLEFSSFGGDKIEPIRLHFYLGAYFYRLVNFLNNDLSLMNCLALFPVVFSAVPVVLIFYLCFLFGVSCLEGFITSLIVGLSPFFLGRTAFSCFDTDLYNLSLPLLVSIAMAHYARKEVPRRRKMLFLVLSGALIGVHSALWSAWWLFFYIFLAAFIVYKFFLEKKYLSDLLLFIASAYLSVVLVSGVDALRLSFSEPIGYLLYRQSSVLADFWPNVSDSVFELQRSSLGDMSAAMHGSFIFYLGICGLLFPFYRKLKADFKGNGLLFCIIFIWFLAGLVLAYFGSRFLMLLVLPLAISFGGALYLIRSFLSQKQQAIGFLKGINQRVYRGGLNCVFSAIVAIPLYGSARLELVPVFNDTWVDMLAWVKEKTPANAVINADWQEGDWIMTMAGRATIQDAHWQYTAIPYWFYRSLLRANEAEAFGILRMIDSGGNLAFETLAKALNNDKYAAFKLIEQLVVLGREDGEVMLSRYIQDRDQLEQAARLLYGPCPPAYLMLNNFMITCLPDTSKAANWDFQSGSAGTSYRFYTPYARRAFADSTGKLVSFANGLTVDKESLTADFQDAATGKRLIPGYLVFAGKDRLAESINPRGNQDYAVLFLEGDGEYRATLFSRPLADTVFFKLYFLGGRGLKHFKLARHESKRNYSNIYLYKIE